jgi:hypothetical protein
VDTGFLAVLSCRDPQRHGVGGTPSRLALNRWAHRSAADCDVDDVAAYAVDAVAAAQGDLHRACLHAAAGAYAEAFSLQDNPALARVVTSFLDDVFRAMTTGSRRKVDDRRFSELRADATAR